MRNLSHRKIILLLLFPILLSGCLDENILRVSEDVEITPSYSLPLGPLSCDINDYFESLDTVTVPYTDSLYYNNVLYPNYLPYISRSDNYLYDFSSLSNDFNRVVSVMFHLVVSNGYPTTAITQVYFANESNTVLDSVFAAGPYVLPPAVLNEEDSVIAPYEEIVDIPMSPYFMQNLGNIRHIIIESIIYTTRPDIKHVKFYTHYAYRVNIAIRIQLRLDTGEI